MIEYTELKYLVVEYFPHLLDGYEFISARIDGHYRDFDDAIAVAKFWAEEPLDKETRIVVAGNSLSIKKPGPLDEKMTPLAEKAFSEPMNNVDTEFCRGLMVGAQYFECSALYPVIKLREGFGYRKETLLELLEGELPAPHTWIDIGRFAIVMSTDSLDLPNDYYLVGAVFDFDCAVGERLTRFALRKDLHIKVIRQNPAVFRPLNQDDINYANAAINIAWFCIEAMQTPGGLCHGVTHSPSRQLRKAAQRMGRPCHEFVEIRLGRGNKRPGGAGDGTGRTVAWHYRRGHKIDHPSPNFPKWRKGCWVGDTDAGIRTHNYIIEVPT